jgi:hypothetical protein
LLRLLFCVLRNYHTGMAEGPSPFRIQLNCVTPHCWGHLGFVRPLPKIHTSHQYLEDLHWLVAIFKLIWGH